jgi:hypothetical protein
MSLTLRQGEHASNNLSSSTTTLKIMEKQDDNEMSDLDSFIDEIHFNQPQNESTNRTPPKQALSTNILPTKQSYDGSINKTHNASSVRPLRQIESNAVDPFTAPFSRTPKAKRDAIAEKGKIIRIQS